MKANKIIFKSDYDTAMQSKENHQCQNTKRFYCSFSAYGLSIIDAKTDKVKVVNDWRNKSYVECCLMLDEILFES